MQPVMIDTPSLRLVLERTEDVLARIDALDPADRAQVSTSWLEQMRSQPPNPWTHGFSMVERGPGTAVGSCAFKGPPDPQGCVEIAYFVEPDCRGRGYAKEAAAGLLAYALAAGARKVLAHTRPETGPSTSVLDACGFRKAGEVQDPEDGLVWRWEYAPQAARA